MLSPSLLCVSRLTSVDREKGVETVIAAMPQVLADFPGATLRIVGTGDDRRRLEALAAAQSAKGEERSVVEFLGSIDDATLRSEYAACDLFVLPSRKEGFGLVYLEALAHGKPCVAADAGGAPEVLGAEALPQAKGADALPRAKGEGPRARRTDAGILVPYGDAEAVAAAIKDLLRNPPDPAVVRTQAERFSYEAFRARLAAALKGVRGKG